MSPMKLTKYILIAAGVVALLATLGWVLRDKLIRQISNPLLQEYGITVVDVSLDALAGSNAKISHLELIHEKGTTVEIEDLRLPIGATPAGSKTYTAGKVSVITSTRSDNEPFEMARLIDQFLSLPGDLGHSEVVVTEFNMPPYRPVHDSHLILGDGVKQLSARVESIAMFGAIEQTDAKDFAVTFLLPAGNAAADAQSITARMQQTENGVSMSGTASLELPDWEAFARLAGIIPDEISIQSGMATLQFDVEIPYDSDQSPSVNAVLVPASSLQLAYAGEPEEIASVVVESGSPIEIAASFPEIEWSLQQAQASLLVTSGEWSRIPVSVSDLTCNSNLACSMSTHIEMRDAKLPIGEFGRLELSSDVHVEFVDAGWRLVADALDANVDAVSLTDDIAVDASFFLEDIAVAELSGILSAEFGVYAPSIQASMSEQVVALPGIKGRITLQGANLDTDLQTVGLHEDGTIEMQHNIDTGMGALSIENATASFGSQKLSSRVSPWPGKWDLVAGNASLDLRADWRQSDGKALLGGQASASVTDVAGNYEDIAFIGLSTSLETAYDSTTGIVLEPSTIGVSLVEAGLPVENIRADYSLDANALAIDVENLRMDAFGGVIRAYPFSFHTARDINNLTLYAESLELTELLSLSEFEAIEVSGSIGARIPVTIEGDAVTIVDGTLSGEPPGGVIRYLPGLAADKDDTSSINLVTRALSNFEFESLTSDVSLNKEGDLDLQLQLTGKNPDLDEKRPIVLNLGVENNIPQMMKSLRAARAVEEILERRLAE